MNNNSKLMLSLMILGALSSCSKAEQQRLSAPSEIVIGVADETIDMQVQTKTAAITSLPASLYYSLTVGTAGSAETLKKESTQASLSGGKIATGLYQTLNPSSYNYYVSNLPIGFGAQGSTLSATNTTDVIAGTVTSSEIAPSVTLEHIFSRTGTLTLNTQEGYDISNIVWKIQSGSGTGTGGTYNIKTRAWSGVTALSEATISSNSDLYLVPGAYTIIVSYTLTKGDWVNSFTKTATVTLVAGSVNNISGTASGGNASEISIAVTLTPWGTNNIQATFQ